MKLKFFVSIFLAASFLLVEAFAQTVLTPRPSPLQEVSQYVGVSKVTIVYSRPGVKNRTIWGDLVPYNEIWRTGANENTTIEFSHPVKINGTEIPAAKYGLHTIPSEKEWVVIFSKDNNLGGSAGYKKENDALRITVKPEKNNFTEWMEFDFENLADNSADVVLKWGELKVPFKVEFDTPALTLKGISDKTGWGPSNAAAQYILQSSMDVNEGLKWAHISVTINENYWNLRTKAQLLAKAGKKDEAVETMEKALTHAEKMSDAPFDLDSMKKKLKEWKG